MYKLLNRTDFFNSEEIKKIWSTIFQNIALMDLN